MAKKNAVHATTLKCSICQAELTAETYAAHVQQQHTAQPPAAAAPAPVTSFQPGWQQPQQQQSGQPQNIMPITGPIKGKDLAGGHYLKGEDVPNGVAEVKFRLVQFVRDPSGRSKLAAQISETYGKSMFGLNTTNIRSLMSLGYEDLQAAIGKTLVCMMGMQPNPQRGGMPTRALFITRVE